MGAQSGALAHHHPLLFGKGVDFLENLLKCTILMFFHNFGDIDHFTINIIFQIIKLNRYKKSLKALIYPVDDTPGPGHMDQALHVLMCG